MATRPQGPPCREFGTKRSLQSCATRVPAVSPGLRMVDSHGEPHVIAAESRRVNRRPGSFRCLPDDAHGGLPSTREGAGDPHSEQFLEALAAWVADAGPSWYERYQGWTSPPGGNWTCFAQALMAATLYA
ncbi:DUF7660 family protein [Streptomyces europaeiscabiei]